MLVEAVMGYFRTRLERELEVLMRPCFITDTTDIEHPVAVFNQELFLMSIDEGQRLFYRGFLGTTSFQEFADSKLEEAACGIRVQPVDRGRVKMTGSEPNFRQFERPVIGSSHLEL
jgi:hypothetical protein